MIFIVYLISIPSVFLILTIIAWCEKIQYYSDNLDEVKGFVEFAKEFFANPFQDLTLSQATLFLFLVLFAPVAALGLSFITLFIIGDALGDMTFPQIIKLFKGEKLC